MRTHRTATLTALLLALAPASSQALELGVQDPQATLAQRNEWANGIHATWERLIVDVGQPGVADQIRASHAAGRHVILTVGGIGTDSRQPSFKLALRYIATLPRADRYTIDNEPDLDGASVCEYRKDWMAARRLLGRKLLWGDFSPHHPVQFTVAAAYCGPLPHHLDFAVHPYQPNDPYARSSEPDWDEGGLGSLRRAHATLAHYAHVHVRWWLTEFGYRPDQRAADPSWLWPRAIHRAEQLHAKLLIVYSAQGVSWDSRPTPDAWAAIRGAFR